MYKIKNIVIVLIVSLFFIPGVKALECEYDNSFKISYDGTNVSYDTDFIYSLFSYLPISSEIEDDGAISEYFGMNPDSCPDKLSMCVYHAFEIDDLNPAKKLVPIECGTDGCKPTNVFYNVMSDGKYALPFYIQTIYMSSYENYDKSKFKYYSDNSAFGIPRLYIHHQIIDNFKKIFMDKDPWGFLQNLWNSVVNSIPGFDTGQPDFAAVYIDCKTLNGTYSSSGIFSDLDCGRLDNLLRQYGGIVEQYKSCGNNQNCKDTSMVFLNSLESNMKSYCSYVTKNYDYNDSQKGCLDNCFKLNTTLNEMKKDTDLYMDLSSGDGECGVSQKVINLISNIFKWGKYIAPVLVIILSIVDFIKALASQNDDEMKKAQGRFVKRLLAGALLFVVPFIIEFILDVFNLVSDNPYCNII